MSRPFAWSVCAVAGALLTACAFSAEPDGRLFERRDSAGVALVRMLHTALDTVRPTGPQIRIGAVGVSGAAHDVFELISDVAVLAGSRVAVVDNRGGRVAVFDSTGIWLHDIGGRGEGPGEHTAPIYVSSRADTVFVWDALQRRLSSYTAEGVFQGSLTLSTRTSAHSFAAVGDGYVEFAESGQLVDPAPARGAVVFTGRDGTLIDTLVGPYPVPERGWMVLDEETGTGRMTNPPALSITPPWTVRRRTLFWLDPIATRIEVRNIGTGALESEIRLPYRAGPPDEDAREAYFQGLQTQTGLPAEAMGRVRATTEFAAVRPPVASLIVDDRSRIWIGHHDPAAWHQDHVGRVWDVLDLRQDRGVRVLFPEGFELRAVERDRAYGTTTLQNGVEVVDAFLVDPGG